VNLTVIVTSALLLSAAVYAEDQKRGGPAPPTFGEVAPFLGTWYAVIDNCDTCDPRGGPELDIDFITVKLEGKDVTVTKRLQVWASYQGWKSQVTSKEVSIDGDTLRYHWKSGKYNGDTELTIKSSGVLWLKGGVSGLYNAAGFVASVYSDDPDPLREVMAQRPTSAGLLSQLVGAMAQAPLPQARVPRQQAPPTIPASSPGTQQAGDPTSQQRPQDSGTRQPGAEGGSAVASGPGPVASPTCVSVQKNPDGSGSWGILNRCDYAIEVQFCVQNAKSSLSCQSSPAGGQTGVKAKGFEYALPFYGEEGEGTVIFAACIAPAVPMNWQATMASR
jgi:hypothetical protein